MSTEALLVVNEPNGTWTMLGTVELCEEYHAEAMNKGYSACVYYTQANAAAHGYQYRTEGRA